MPRAAEAVRDRLIEHDLDLRRFIGGHQREVNARLARLEKDICAALMEIDPMGVSGNVRQAARLARLEKKVKELTDDAFADIRRMNRAALTGTVRAETRATVTAIQDGEPE